MDKPVQDAIEARDTGALIRALGGDIQRRNEQGWTVLHSVLDEAIDGAVQEGNPIDWSGMEFVLCSGADPAVTDHEGRTVFDHAKSYGWNAERELFRFLLEYNKTTPPLRFEVPLNVKQSLESGLK